MKSPTPKIRILKPNPKQPGCKAWHRFNLYKDGMTVQEFLRAGGTRSDLQWDVKNHFIDITTLDNKPNGTAAQPSSNRAAALKRIQALAAKTIDNGCTEEEAFAAAIKMGELMDKYGIESSEAELKAETCVTGIHGAERSKVHESSWCATEIAHYCDCRVWHRTGTGQIAFFGLPADVEVATYLSRVITGAMDRSFKEFKKAPDYPSWDQSRRVRVTFLASMAARINARLREMRVARHTEQQVTTTGTSLVLVKTQVVAEQFAQLGLKLGKANGHARQGSYSSAAQAAGQAAGNKVHLGTGITGATHGQRKIS